MGKSGKQRQSKQASLLLNTLSVCQVEVLADSKVWKKNSSNSRGTTSNRFSSVRERSISATRRTTTASINFTASVGLEANGGFTSTQFSFFSKLVLLPAVSVFACVTSWAWNWNPRRIQTMVQGQVMQLPEVIVHELQKPVPRKILLSN